MKKIQVAVIFATFITVISLPYVIAASAAGDAYSFVGFLLNPIDGGSYLAKMQQGFHGSWTFTLPFTAEPGEGIYLFLTYLFFGHLARVSGINLLVVFHLARVTAATFMLWEAYQLARVALPQERFSRYALKLMAFGSGVGWLFVVYGVLTSDFWVAEAFPFLSAYTNPHFPLGLGIMFWILRKAMDPAGRWLIVRLLLAGVILSLALPFGVVIVGAVVFGLNVWEFLMSRRLSWHPVWIAVAAGIPYGLYSYLATLSHPVLAGWNQQNITLTPPVWDLLVSFSPGLLLALFGLRRVWPRRNEPVVRMLILWLGLTLMFAYFPTGIQRRFLLGVYAPVAILAVYGIEWLALHGRIQVQTWFAIALFLSLPTNLMIIAGAIIASDTKPPELYLTRGEKDALDWIADRTQEDSVFLASPGTSLWIPARTNRQVVYGHPFESVPASGLEEQVERFYAGETGFQPFEPVDYMFFGPREREWLAGQQLPECPVEYQNGEVTICAARAAN